MNPRGRFPPRGGGGPPLPPPRGPYNNNNPPPPVINKENPYQFKPAKPEVETNALGDKGEAIGGSEENKQVHDNEEETNAQDYYGEEEDFETYSKMFPNLEDNADSDLIEGREEGGALFEPLGEEKPYEGHPTLTGTGTGGENQRQGPYYSDEHAGTGTGIGTGPNLLTGAHGTGTGPTNTGNKKSCSSVPFKLNT